MAYSRYLTMANKPRIRFKGFTEDWEQRKLGDIATITGGGTPSTNISEYWNGDIDWYSPVEIGENRYVSRSTRKITKLGLEKSSAKILPVGTVLFTSRAGIGNTAILQAEGCTNQGFQSITPNSKELDTYFLYTMTPKLKRYGEVTGAGSTFVEVSGKQMEQMNLMIPSLEEQKHVSQLFELMDDAITLHQCKLEKLKLTKKALLQKLFPKNGKHIPEIRFKGFTDAWEQREFSDIFAEVKSGLSRMLSNDDIGVPVVRANNINDGQLNLVDDIKYWYKNDPQGANTNNYLIEQGDILINFINSEAKMGTAAYVTRRPERDTIYTTNILRCKVNDEYNPYFIYSLTFLNSYKNYIASITKPAVNQASFTTVDFKKYSIKIPTIKEQNQIADLIEIFNKFITLHQRKLERLQEVKKGLLQKMFV